MAGLKVGFVGLGSMGTPICTRLVEAALTGKGGIASPLLVYNRSPGKADRFKGAAGATVVESVAAACVDRDVVVTMLSNDEALRAVVDGDEGLGNGILDRLRPGGVHMAMGTHSVKCAEEMTAAHATRGVKFVAAPVLGRPPAAAAGQLVVVVAGPSDAVESLKPLFAACGRKLVEAGPEPRSASAIKLANNMVLGCAIAAMGEGQALAQKYGVDAHVFNDVLTDGLFNCPAYKVYGDLITNEKYDATGGFTVDLALKDARLMMAAGEDAAVPLPSLAVYRDRLLSAKAHGHGDSDWVSIAREQAHASGLKR